MQLLGQPVRHNAFGTGVITGLSGNIITIDFAQGEKRFQYPDAFSRFLTLKDAGKQNEIRAGYERRLRAERAERQKELERQERLGKIRSMKVTPYSQAAFDIPWKEAKAAAEADARRLVEQKREGSKLKIVLDGQQIPVQIKEKAVNLLNNDILHLSFQALQADQKVNSVIHIFLTNTEKVTDALERMLMEIPYASLPEDMIDTITVDVEGMPCGTVLTVGDIPELNSGKLDLQADKTEIVLRISDKTRGPSRAAKQTEE